MSNRPRPGSGIRSCLAYLSRDRTVIVCLTTGSLYADARLLVGPQRHTSADPSGDSRGAAGTEEPRACRTGRLQTRAGDRRLGSH